MAETSIICSLQNAQFPSKMAKIVSQDNKLLCIRHYELIFLLFSDYFSFEAGLPIR
jgi:hypothetical protein